MKNITVTYRAYIDAQIEVSEEVYNQIKANDFTPKIFQEIDKKASESSITNTDYYNIICIFDSDTNIPLYEF